MTTTLDRVIEAARDRASLEDLLREHPFPVTEGTTATFLFHGPADEVQLKHWIYGLASQLPFNRITGTDAWYLQMELPPQSRVEYKLLVRTGDHWALVRDPLNPQLATDPYGANSVVHGEGYERPEWTWPDSEARPGTIVDTRVRSHALGGDRHLRVYLPPRMRPSRRYPLLIMHDGEDYLRFASLQAILDTLIYRFEIPQMIVALTQSPNRLKEYAADEAHGRFLLNELIPALESKFPVDPRPEMRGLGGASFGAVASLAAAWMHPGAFGGLLLQSGSFAFTDIGDHHPRGPLFDPVVRFMNRFRAAPGDPARRIFVSCGTYESLIYENRSLAPLLQSTAADIRYVESRDGHNWENWRDRLREGLAWLFPGPLWMVYE